MDTLVADDDTCAAQVKNDMVVMCPRIPKPHTFPIGHYWVP